MCRTEEDGIRQFRLLGNKDGKVSWSPLGWASSAGHAVWPFLEEQ